jgi:hypothetical protein
MSKRVRVTPSNASEAANVTGVSAAVFGTPAAGQLVGTTHKQFTNQAFSGEGMLTLDLADVGALAVGSNVLVTAQSATHTLNGLISGVVEAVNTSTVVPSAWQNNGSSQNIPLSVPGGAASAGDRIFIIVGLHDTSAGPSGAGHNRTATTPAGYTLIREFVPNWGSDKNWMRYYVWDRVLDADITTLANVVTNENSHWVAGVIKTRGDRTVDPTWVQEGWNANTFAAPAITATFNNSILIRFAFAMNWPRWYSTPESDIEIIDVRNPNYGSFVSSYRIVNAGYIAPTAFIPSEVEDGPPVGDMMSALSIVLDGDGGTNPPPPPPPPGDGGGGGGGGGDPPAAYSESCTPCVWPLPPAACATDPTTAPVAPADVCVRSAMESDR